MREGDSPHGPANEALNPAVQRPGALALRYATHLLGAASALLGVLYALVDPDLKRLLAYSTVENVGLIFLGLLANLFAPWGLSLIHI